MVSPEGLGNKSKTWHKPGMRPAHRYVIVCLLCTLTALVNAQQRNSDNEKVLALEKKWTEAYKRREISILTSLLADDFIITVEDGSTYGKEGYIAHSADPSVRVEIAEQTDLRVRTRDNVAVVTGAYYEKGKSKGKAYEY